MMRRFLFLIVFGLSALVAGQTLARPVSDAEKAALDKVLTRYEADMARKDMAAIISAMPPRIFTQLAGQSGMSVDDLKAMVIKMSAGASDLIRDFGFEQEAVVFSELPDGTVYALVPTSTVIKTKEGPTYRANSQTLAVLEGSDWFLMRVNEPQQLTLLRSAYPGFVGVELPEGSMELLED
ncbi:hypothetical protein [Rhizobium sp.]